MVEPPHLIFGDYPCPPELVFLLHPLRILSLRSNPERRCCESAALNMPANLENSAVVTGLEKVSFHSNP